MTSKIGDAGLRLAYSKRIDELEMELQSFGVHRRARNYAIVVQHEK